MKAFTLQELVHMTMTGEERFYLASEVEEVLKRQAAAAINGMNAATAISSGQLQQAYRLNRESSPEALESERAANAILTAENERLRAGLKFYAEGTHFGISDKDAWDTVTGEPPNFWCDEAGTATIEDGTIANMVLAGHSLQEDGQGDLALVPPDNGSPQ